jgi:hypothetical protein
MAPKRIHVPKQWRHARALYRLQTGDATLGFDGQKREATRRAARYVRRWHGRRVNVHALVDQRTKWKLIAQLKWSQSRRCPVFEEL